MKYKSAKSKRDTVVYDKRKHKKVDLKTAKKSKVKSVDLSVPSSDKIYKKKNKHKKNYIIHYIIISMILIIIAVVLSLTVFFKIENIIVEIGNVNKDVIAQQSKISIGENLILVNTKEAENNILANNISFDTVTVKRSFPASVRISAEYATVKYVAYSNNKFYSISEKGRIIEIDTVNTYTAVLIYGLKMDGCKLGDYIESDKTDIIQNLINSFEKNGITPITAIEIDDVSNLKIYTMNRFLIKIGTEKDIEYKIEDVKTIIENKLSENEIGEIDASTSGKVYFRETFEVPMPNTDSDVKQDVSSGIGSEPLQDNSSEEENISSNAE